MTTIAFPTLTKTTQLPTGTTYSYVHFPPTDVSKPWILFLHGFPSSSYDWRYQIPFFSKNGYGIIVPDLLGYGGTDKPTDVEAYRMKKMSEEVIAILDAEGVDKVLGVGHDWGSGLLSRLANYFPERFISFSFLSVGYLPPRDTYDVDAFNGALEQELGYPPFAYWDFFTSPDAGELMDRDPKDTTTLFYTADDPNLKSIFCVKGATRDYFASREDPPSSSSLLTRPTLVNSEELITHSKIFDPKNGGYGPALNWYKAAVSNVNAADESSIPPERHHIHQRTLAILGSREFICVPAMQEPDLKEYCHNLRIEMVETGHWLMLEKPDRINTLLKGFFEEEGVNHQEQEEEKGQE